MCNGTTSVTLSVLQSECLMSFHQLLAKQNFFRALK